VLPKAEAEQQQVDSDFETSPFNETCKEFRQSLKLTSVLHIKIWKTVRARLRTCVTEHRVRIQMILSVALASMTSMLVSSFLTYHITQKTNLLSVMTLNLFIFLFAGMLYFCWLCLDMNSYLCEHSILMLIDWKNYYQDDVTPELHNLHKYARPENYYQEEPAAPQGTSSMPLEAGEVPREKFGSQTPQKTREASFSISSPGPTQEVSERGIMLKSVFANSSEHNHLNLQCHERMLILEALTQAVENIQLQDKKLSVFGMTIDRSLVFRISVAALTGICSMLMKAGGNSATNFLHELSTSWGNATDA